MDQVPCDSDCLVNRRASGFDNRIRDIRLALGCVNGLTGRFAGIYSTSKPDTGTIPDARSNRSACNESNTDSYTDTDAITESSPYAGAPSDSSTPPQIASLIGFEHLNARHAAASSSRNAASFSFARKTKRFPSRCASTIQIVRPSESTAETQPRLQPAFEIVSDDFPVLHVRWSFGLQLFFSSQKIFRPSV
jgi:hypothetical protein